MDQVAALAEPLGLHPGAGCAALGGRAAGRDGGDRRQSERGHTVRMPSPATPASMPELSRRWMQSSRSAWPSHVSIQSMPLVATSDHWLVLDRSMPADPFEILDAFLAEHGFGIWNEPFTPVSRRPDRRSLPGLRAGRVAARRARAPAARAVPAAAAGLPRSPRRWRAPCGSGQLQRRPLRADVDGRAAQSGRRRRSRGDRARRRVPGEHRPAPVGAVLGRPLRRRRSSGRSSAPSTAERCTATAGRSCRRPRAVPSAPRRRRRDDADQGHAAGRRAPSGSPTRPRTGPST